MNDMPATEQETATFGAGCFWGVEAAFRKVPGVRATAVGYMGGTVADPVYEQVCSGQSGHTEVVHVMFDPSVIPYAQLLEVFWECHDPTQVNRQGPDVGWQYRSVIFTHTAEQERTAQNAKETLARSGKWVRPIATAIAPAGTFWRAEEYHQQYFEKHGGGVCHG